ncbi:hypothetical protein HGA34_05845 [Candidatus Falkowbacteria bacterium]|nr:hypothetical protein [Candidatus Falkowbacteria bacterium]
MAWLIAAYSIGFAFLAIRRLEWALMLTFFALPAYLIRFNVGVPMTLLEVMILTVAAVWAWQNRLELFAGVKRSWGKGVKAPERVPYPFGNELVALLVISLVAVGVAGFSSSALGIWKAYFFEPALFYLVALNVIGKKEIPLPKKLNMIIWPLVASALAVALFAVYQKFTGQFISNPLWATAATRRVVSFFGYPNAVGLYVESIIFLALGLFIFSRQCVGGRCSRNRLILLLTVFTSLLAIIFAKSIGASLGVAAGFVAFASLFSKRSRKVTLVLLAVAAVAVILIQPLRHQVSKYATLNDFSGQVRRSQWRETWTMLKTDNRWLWGAGLSNYQAAIKPFHKEGVFIEDYDDPDSHRKLVFNAEYRAAHWQPLEIYMYPHNIILNFWTELGLAGLLLFVWIIAKFFLVLAAELNPPQQNNERAFLVGAAAAMLALIAHGAVDVPYFKNDLAVIFWLLIALVSLVRLNQISNKS